MEADHDGLGATFGTRGGRWVVEHYGRPDRAVSAVRNGAGVIESAAGVVQLTGDDRLEYVENAVSNRVPATDGRAAPALLLSPEGRIEEAFTVYQAGDRLLVVTPPGRADPLASRWAENVFIEDVEVEPATEDLATVAVHGPTATEVVASVLSGASPPEDRFRFVRGTIGDEGVTVCRTDAPCGEESYAVICARPATARVHQCLLTDGVGAAPIGYQTLETLTLEAGTPRFATDLVDQLPNDVGARWAIDFEKGCFIGQEVVSRIENRGRPSSELVGLAVESDRVPAADGAVRVDDREVGTVTRAAWSPTCDGPIAFALVEYGLEADAVVVETADGDGRATVRSLPFVEGSDRSGRIPVYT